MSGFRLSVKSGFCLFLSLLMIVQGIPVTLLPQESAREPTLSRAEDDWPQFHYDAARTGATLSPAPMANTTIWSFQTGGEVNGSLAMAGDMVYAGSADGYLYALNSSTGDLIWKAKTGGGVSSPAVSGNLVYAGSEDGSLHAFNASTGGEAFSYPTGDPIHCPVLLTASAVIFGNDAGAIFALDLAGNRLWSNSTGLRVRMAPATNGNLVYVCAGNGLGAYSVLTGERVWNVTAGTGNLSHPCFFQTNVFVGSEDGNLYAFHFANGNSQWNTLLSGAITACPAFSGGSLFIGTRGGRFHIVNADTGAAASYPVGAAVDSSAAISPELALFGTSAGLSALHLNGSELWTIAVAGGIASSPSISRSRAFVGTTGGNVLAFGFRHTARIQGAGPSPVPQGQPVTFTGSSPDCAPVAYEWRSGLDGRISIKPDFTLSTLSLGYHLISFRIQDGNWTWSDWDSMAVEVTAPLDWPMFRKDTSHRGVSAGEVPLTNTLVWSSYVGGQVYSSPVVRNGTIFVGSRSVAPYVFGGLYALDTVTGALKWSYPDMNGAVDATAACADGMVFMGDDAGNIIAFNATDRTIQWNYKTGNIQGSPVVVNGKVIIPSRGDAKVIALDQWTGRPVWNFSIPDPINSSIWSSPAVDGGLVLFGSNNWRFYALDLSTGREAWNFTTKGAIRESSPCVYNDTVFFGSTDGRLYALNLKNGTKKWEYATAKDITSSPSVSNGKVLFGSWDNKFRALDAEYGQWIWEFQASGPIHSSAAVGGGLAFFGAYDGKVYAVNETTGQEVWSYDTASQFKYIRSSPALVDGRIYIGTESGYVLAFGKAPDLAVPEGEISFAPPSPQVGQEMRITSRVHNIGTLDATATARISDGLPGIEIARENISVPAGSYVELSGNWTVQPGVHRIVVNVTNTSPFEAIAANNQASREYIPPPQSGWTMFKANPERTSTRNNLTTPNSNNLSWNAPYETHAETYSSPVTAGSRLYQASGTAMLALDPRGPNPTLLWRYEAGSRINSTPAVSNLIIFGTEDGRVIALNEWDGSLMWTQATGGPVPSSPLIVSETVYVGSSDGYLYAFSFYNSSLWRMHLGGPVTSSPAFDPVAEMLVVGSQLGDGQGRITCLSLNGNEAWNLTIPAPVLSTPAIFNNIAYFGSDDGNLTAAEVVSDGTDDGIPDAENSTADRIWATNLTSLAKGDNRVRSSPAVDATGVYVGAGFNTLVALDTATGRVKWNRDLGSEVSGKYLLSSPALADNRLFVGADAMYALNARNGATVWSYPTGDWVWSSPAISSERPSSQRGMVFAATEAGRLCAFSSTVPLPPYAVISSPGEGQRFRVGESIPFNASASWDPDGEIVNFTWDFGDGNSSYEAIPAGGHRYTQPGEYNVSLTVRDDNKVLGLEGNAYVHITVRMNSAPVLMDPQVSSNAPPLPASEGDISTLFQLKVTYYDEDNDTAAFVVARVGELNISLEPADPADLDAADGKSYFCETQLPSGIFDVFFEASDGVLSNRSSTVANITVTQLGNFSYQDTINVQIFYAGRGAVRFDRPIGDYAPPSPLVKAYSEFEIIVDGIDRWYWANISVDISNFNGSYVNLSTTRIYQYNTTAKTWTLGEKAGIDPEKNRTHANVTSLGIFSVFGQQPFNQPPEARLVSKDLAIMEGETAFFNGSGSFDPENESLTYFWDFGDSTPPGPGPSTAEHKYTKAGRYTVTLVVSDGKINSTAATLTITVKQKGGEQVVLLIVVIIVLVVGIIFLLPRGKKQEEDRWREEEEEFQKGFEKRKRPGKKGAGGKPADGPPGEEE